MGEQQSLLCKNEEIEITEREFTAVREIMYELTGVYLRPSKKKLVINRLRKRLDELGLKSFEAYVAILRKGNAAEVEFFVNAITTNETYFFRHTKQFNYFFEQVLPRVCEYRASVQREVRVWSAACSTGEEPYSIAIALQEFFKNRPGWRGTVYASDVNSRVLARARAGQYRERSLRFTPQALRQRYFRALSSAPYPEGTAIYEVVPNVKNAVVFQQHNLVNVFPHRDIDVVFLRNVMIYFDQNMKEQVLHMLQRILRPGGYLIIGLSENLNNIDEPMEYIYGGIYRKQQ
ncbi:MAG: protein-glutamate O-methyltransferase CheR [Candidatus Omnitrophica bacterium]|nr:protein-glutamate O-methyltransferase CheR [Candidatus Omnitrophota bacterium]